MNDQSPPVLQPDPRFPPTDPPSAKPGVPIPLGYNYDRAIADAARAWYAAEIENAVWRTLKTDEAERQCHEWLSWMIDAEKHGWNPADYKPGGE